MAAPPVTRQLGQLVGSMRGRDGNRIAVDVPPPVSTPSTTPSTPEHSNEPISAYHQHTVTTVRSGPLHCKPPPTPPNAASPRCPVPPPGTPTRPSSRNSSSVDLASPRTARHSTGASDLPSSAPFVRGRSNPTMGLAGSGLASVAHHSAPVSPQDSAPSSAHGSRPSSRPGTGQAVGDRGRSNVFASPVGGDADGGGQCKLPALGGSLGSSAAAKGRRSSAAGEPRDAAEEAPLGSRTRRHSTADGGFSLGGAAAGRPASPLVHMSLPTPPTSIARRSGPLDTDMAPLLSTLKINRNGK